MTKWKAKLLILAVKPQMFDAVARPYVLAFGETFNTLPSCGVGGPMAQAAEAEKKRKEARREQGQAKTFPELLAIGKERGYKNPAAWAAMVLRGRR